SKRKERHVLFCDGSSNSTNLSYYYWIYFSLELILFFYCSARKYVIHPYYTGSCRMVYITNLRLFLLFDTYVQFVTCFLHEMGQTSLFHFFNWFAHVNHFFLASS